jgi:hypothetical protein
VLHQSLNFEIGAAANEQTQISPTIRDTMYYTMAEETPFMEQVPVDLLKRVASFLAVGDLISLSFSNPQIRSSLSISKILLPTALITEQCWARLTPHARRYQSIPVPLRNRVHSVMLKGRFLDQRMSRRPNGDGQLYVVASSKSRGHRLVAESPVATDLETDFELQFNYTEDETYNLWYKVGVGHHLTVFGLKTSIVIFDNPAGQHLSKIYSAMEKKGALRGHEESFHFRILQGTARALLAQIERGEQPDINLTSFFESTGIAVNEESLVALDQIASSMMEMSDFSTVSKEAGEVETEEEIKIRQQLFPLVTVENRAQINNDDEGEQRRADPLIGFDVARERRAFEHMIMFRERRRAGLAAFRQRFEREDDR